MGLRDLFKKQEDDFDPLADLTLSKLKLGYMVDYDLKTWEVTDYSRYDYGDGYETEEWELTSGSEVCYLERGEDDEVEWSLCKKIPIGVIEEDVRKSILETEDPPNRITCKGETFYLDESGGAYMHQKGEPTGEFIFWSFVDEEEDNFVTIEQWGENKFEAAKGQYVEEYQFTNILPAAG